MWRLVALGSVGLAIAGASLLLPTINGEEQLRSLTHIATQGSDVAHPANAGVGDLTPVPTHKSATLAAILTPDRPTAPVTAEPTEASGQIVARLQEQLRRVGCFKGKAQGHWDAATRRAMARFNDRVGAHMPLDAPNPILLTLVEKYDNRACGTPCSPGTSPNASGLCVSTQTLASVAPALPQPAPTPIAAKVALAAAPAPSIAVAAAPATPVEVAALATTPAKSVATRVEAVAPLPMPVPKVVVPSNGNNWAPTIVATPPAGSVKTVPRIVVATPVQSKPIAPAPVEKT